MSLRDEDLEAAARAVALIDAPFFADDERWKDAWNNYAEDMRGPDAEFFRIMEKRVDMAVRRARAAIETWEARSELRGCER